MNTPILAALGGSRFLTLANVYAMALTEGEKTTFFFTGTAHAGIDMVDVWPCAGGHARFNLDFYRGDTLIKIDREIPATNLPRAFHRATGIDVRL